MFDNLIRKLYEPDIRSIAEDANNRLSRLFGYSARLPKIEVRDLPVKYGVILDYLRGRIYQFALKIGGMFDPIRDTITLDRTSINNVRDRIGIFFHELGHKYLRRFYLPKDVEEGYASWLTQKLTGYARDAYGNLRENMNRVYQQLGDAVFNPRYRNEIVREFRRASVYS